MDYLLGIDLGTSSVKCLLTDVEGEQIGLTHGGYDIIAPREGYAEQSPETWWQTTSSCISKLLLKSGVLPSSIKAIGLSGQMHGTVVLDRAGRPVCNAIIHCDARSEREVQEIYAYMGHDQIDRTILNPICTGFQPASLLWLRNHRPDIYQQIHIVISPKDYIRYRLTGSLGTERTDAAATTLMDIQRQEWALPLIRALHLDPSWFPPIAASVDIAGQINTKAAEQTGLEKGTPVIYGAGDQPAQALGNHMTKPGTATSNIGSSGQICTPTSRPVYNPVMNTHTFTHAAEHTWYIMGAQLSAGLALKWISKSIIGKNGFAQLDRLAMEVSPKATPIFMPYLQGERSPHMDPNARGVFFGLSMEQDYRHLYRAVMEGVVFSLRDSLEIIEGLGIPIHTIIASGGGARSDLWMQIQADIFNREITTTALQEQANLGAVILAAVGGGYYDSIEEACAAFVKPGHKAAVPNRENHLVYEERYQIYLELYPKLKDLFVSLKSQSLNKQHVLEVYDE